MRFGVVLGVELFYFILRSINAARCIFCFFDTSTDSWSDGLPVMLLNGLSGTMLLRPTKANWI